MVPSFAIDELEKLVASCTSQSVIDILSAVPALCSGLIGNKDGPPSSTREYTNNVVDKSDKSSKGGHKSFSPATSAGFMINKYIGALMWYSATILISICTCAWNLHQLGISCVTPIPEPVRLTRL